MHEVTSKVDFEHRKAKLESTRGSKCQTIQDMAVGMSCYYADSELGLPGHPLLLVGGSRRSSEKLEVNSSKTRSNIPSVMTSSCQEMLWVCPQTRAHTPIVMMSLPGNAITLGTALDGRSCLFLFFGSS